MPNANDAISEAAAHPDGIEEAIRRSAEDACNTHPRDLTKSQLEAVIARARFERASWEAKEKK